MFHAMTPPGYHRGFEAKESSPSIMCRCAYNAYNERLKLAGKTQQQNPRESATLSVKQLQEENYHNDYGHNPDY